MTKIDLRELDEMALVDTVFADDDYGSYAVVPGFIQTTLKMYRVNQIQEFNFKRVVRALIEEHNENKLAGAN